jgi:two-component sensor histidine kinase
VTEAHQPRISPAARTVSRPETPLSATRLWRSRFLSREEQHALADAVSIAKPVGPNIDLVREGEHADSLFIVTEGWACRYATTREGGRQLPAVLVPGDVGNLDSLMFDRLDYGVRTITQTKVVTLPRNRALALAAQHPGIARTFTWLGLIENMILSKWVLSLGRRSATERLAHLLCELSARLGAEDGEESSFAFPLTQEQVADALGLTSVHVNRTMQHLRTDGLIATANRTMTIPDVAKLRQVGGFDPRYLHIAAPGEARLAPSWGPVASNRSPTAPSDRHPAQDDDLLLRETNHRCSNDLQLVVSLLALQSRRAANPEVRGALTDAMERVSVLAHARRTLHQEQPATLELALRQVCAALDAQAEPRSILISLEAADDVQGLLANHITTLALVVNELATNAIKHAFEEGRPGRIRVTIAGDGGGEAVVRVEDDGLPFLEPGGNGLGMGIAKRLMASIGGLFIPPPPGTKLFELRVPAESLQARA